MYLIDLFPADKQIPESKIPFLLSNKKQKIAAIATSSSLAIAYANMNRRRKKHLHPKTHDGLVRFQTQNHVCTNLYNQLVELPKSLVPTECFTIFDAQNPPVNVSELHSICRSTGY